MKMKKKSLLVQDFLSFLCVCVFLNGNKVRYCKFTCIMVNLTTDLNVHFRANCWINFPMKLEQMIQHGESFPSCQVCKRLVYIVACQTHPALVK